MWLFCEIIAGRAESSLIYEDEHVIAFMDIRPLTPGHVLVVPRTHADDLQALDEDLGAHLFLADGEAAFQEAFHVHLHVLRGRAGTESASRHMAPARPRELDPAAEQVRQAMRMLSAEAPDCHPPPPSAACEC